MMISQGLALSTHGLTKSYSGVDALKSLNLEVPEHSIFGFLGPNGAGKSTTIKMLLGLTRPTSGTGTVCGHDIVRESVKVRQRVGYLAQDPRFYDYMTARQTLRFTAHLFYAGPEAAIEERVEEALDLVGLGDKADRPVRSFSGGERQRLGIAQAIVNRPEVLILDEPAASLDPLGRRDVLEIMGRLRQQCTIFYSTHILDDVQRVSDTVAILHHGSLIAQAPVETLLATGDRTVYTVTIQGNDTAARREVSGQPWVTSLSSARENGYSRWSVSVASSDAAEDQLLRLILADRSLRVVAFERKKLDLEEIFVNLVGGKGQ